MAERLSALAAGYRPGSFGALGAAGPGIVIAERRNLAIVQVAAPAGEAATLQVGLTSVLGIAPPDAPNRVSSTNTASILWVGPQRFLVVEAEQGWRDLEAVLRSALAGSAAAVTDVGSGRTVFRISGPRTRDLVAKGSGIDFHPRVFPAGACAQGLLGHVGALFHAVDDTPVFDLYVARSFGLTVWEWLQESAAEFGYRVE
jgi:heterotetrameric sarcosine oxidase gamma subunit